MRDLTYEDRDTMYYCTPKTSLIFLQKYMEISLVTGTHQGEKSNSDVEGFYIYGPSHKVHYFPRGLEKSFPKLKGLRCSKVELKEIHQDDLEPFTELIYVDFYDNDIQYIEKDLFKFNTKLKGISFQKNKIAYIDPNVFDSFAGTVLWLQENVCKLSEAINSRSEVLEVIKSVKHICSDVTSLINTKQAEIVTHLDKKFEEIETKLKEGLIEMNKSNKLVQFSSVQFRSFEMIAILIAIPAVLCLIVLVIALSITLIAKSFNNHSEEEDKYIIVEDPIEDDNIYEEVDEVQM